MTEALGDTDLAQGILHVQTNAIDPTASEILEGLDGLQTMEAYALSIEAARKKFLDSRVMDADEQSVVRLSEFGGSRRTYYRALAKVGRRPYRDRYELHNTSLKVVSVLAKLHGPNFVYAKTRQQARGEGPQYTLGKITSTVVTIEPDHPEVPLENRVVVRIKTPSRLEPEGEKETAIFVDDIAAQFEKHGGNTGIDTPIVAVGKRAVRGFVQRAYLEPRAERKACGNDSCDIFAALCESGTRLIDLGFETEHVEPLRAQVSAGLKRVCNLRATYNHEILMLPPLCDSMDQALEIINSICGNRVMDDILPELADEYRLLAALRPR